MIPYPARDRGWGNWSFVQYSYTESKKHTVGLEVYLFPKPNSGWSAMTADVEVVRKPEGALARRLLDAEEVPRPARRHAYREGEDEREEAA